MTRCHLMHLAFVISLTLFAGQAVVMSADQFDKEGLEFFEKRIRPLLVDRCYKCHSEKAETLQGDLYVDSREGLLKGGDQGPAIEPGEPSRSLLIQAVKYEMDDLKMPPDKRLDDEQIADLEKWIKIGAPAPRLAEKRSATTRSPMDVQATRTNWPFQPPVEPTLPSVKQGDWATSPIDRFILAKLEERGLQPAMDAEKQVFLRRLTFDLTGLPPTPDEISEFLGDQRPDAVSRLVDRLLASPQYGERWGRHWMDVIRYADTAGDNSDYPIPQMFKYRNWIIRAWNADLPYDEFVRQQLAGDLLPSESTEEGYDKAIATGYIANARRFGSRVTDYPQHLTIEDTIDNLGRTFLGLTINCARCHDHKFDPLTNEDYYALYGFFHSTRYPWPGIELEKKQRDFVPLASAEVVAAAMRDRTTREQQLTANLKECEGKKSDADRLVRELSQAVESAKSKPSQTSHETGDLASRLTSAKAQSESASKELQKAKQALETWKQSPLPFETAYAVTEGTKIEDVCVQIKGDPERTGAKVRRRFPTVLGGQTLRDNDPTSGRLELTEWLVDRSNPLTARVITNRLWNYHFGRGIVATPSDFGKQGRAPTHPELLDFLACQLMDAGWSLKTLQRRIVLSHTYHMASASARAAEASIADPDNDLLWHFRSRRLDAESLRDAVLACADNLDRSPGGPHPFPNQSAWDFTQHKPFRAVYETNHRSVYLMTQRIQRHPYLAIFDGPDTSASTATRVTSTTTLQALFLLNDQFVHAQAEQLAGRLLRDGATDVERIELAFLLVLGRQPSALECTAAHDYVRDSKHRQAENTPTHNEQTLRAWSSLARTMLRLNEFVYVD